MAIQIPDDVAQGDLEREPLFMRLVGGGDRLLLHEPFGMKLDRRTSGAARPGGIFEVDPTTGRLVRRLVPEMHVGRLVVAPDGQTLYAIDVPSPSWSDPPPRLVKVDRRAGAIGRRVLTSDVWNLSLASIPVDLLPSGDVTVPF